MQTDLYDLRISTSSDTAATAYRAGQHHLLGAEARMPDAFENSIAHDPGFAMAHAGMACARQATADMPSAKQALKDARDLTGGITDREASHIHAIGLLVDEQCVCRHACGTGPCDGWQQ